jgi:23S rRNA pseudouridine2605 synthase
MNEILRLQVYLARCGLGSRRYCETLITAGRVMVNGRQAVLGCKVTGSDRVTLDKKTVQPEGESVYLAINKPRGYVCSNSDPQGRPLAGDLVKDSVSRRLFHVGRLDINSSGLIFYTNDGSFSRVVSHPSAGIEKEYLVEAAAGIPEAVLQAWQEGLHIDGELLRLKKFAYKNPQKVLLTLEQGKNREIRRVFMHYAVDLKRIHRVRIGCVRLGKLPSGGFRFLSRKEVDWFLHKTIKEQALGRSD